MVQEHDLKIIKIIQETPEVRLFRVEYPKNSDLIYLPGQFFMVSTPDDPHVKVSRAYSVASSPANKEYIEIGLNKVGVFTTKLFEMKEGDLLRFKGPYGKFSFDWQVKSEVLLIGAGTGITPLMSIIRYCSDGGLGNKLTLLYSAKKKEEIIYSKELEEHGKRNPQFDYCVTLTREEKEKWNGRVGRIDLELMGKSIADTSRVIVYICGAREFVFAMIDILNRLGVSKERIKTDVWG